MNDKQTKNFLYISYFFPPISGAEPRYNLTVINQFAQKGYSPTILTAPKDARYPREQTLVPLITKKAEIIQLPWYFEKNKYQQELRKLLRIPPNPLRFQGWKKVYSAAQKAIAEKKYDFVYSVYGLASAVKAGLKIKKETGVPWVVDLRDPWMYSTFQWDFLKNNSLSIWYKYHRRNCEKILKDVVKHTDLINVESPMHEKMLVEEFNINPKKVTAFGIGYNETYFKNIPDPLISCVKKPVIGLIGSVYYGYEKMVRPFLKAVSELANEGHECTILTVGGATGTFSKIAQTMGLKNYIGIDKVDYLTALGYMKTLDFGLVFGLDDFPSNISSKLWEYMRFELPIIARVPEKGSMAKIIQEGNCGYILPNNADMIKSQLKKAIENFQSGNAPGPKKEYIQNFELSKNINGLISRIETLVTDKL